LGGGQIKSSAERRPDRPENGLDETPDRLADFIDGREARFVSCPSASRPFSVGLQSHDRAVTTPCIALVPRQTSVTDDGGSDPSARWNVTEI
jgi:hypothetical protein